MYELPFSFSLFSFGKHKMKQTQKNNLIKVFSLSILLLGLGHFSWAADTSTDADIENNIIMQANQERVKDGLKELSKNELLSEAAKLKAQDMIANNYFSHTSPSGIDPWHWLEETEYHYKYAGENLAMNFSTAVGAHKAWMKSQSHRENILSDRYTEIGVAVLDGILNGKQTYVAVQFFGMPLSGGEQMGGSSINEAINQTNVVEIEEASVQPWAGVETDEMIVYAKVMGEPISVEIHFDGQTHSLQKMGENRYMSLVSIEGADLRKDSLIIKAELEEGKALFYQIPQEQYLAYVKGADTEEKQMQKQEEELLGAQLEQSRIINSQNVALALFMLACMVLVGNVWVLEKEEERLLLQYLAH
jgi:uncharacterized protein YkwD